MNDLPGTVAEVMPRLVRRLAAARDTDAALRALLDDVVEATGVDVGVVYRWDGEQGAFLRVSATPASPDFGATVRPGQEPIGRVAETRAPRVLAGSGTGAPAGDGPERWGLASLIVVPLVYAERLAGAIVVGRRTADAAPDADAGALVALAELAGPVLALAEAAGRGAETRGRLDTLMRAGRELAHDLNNDLTMPIGALELLRERPDLPADVLELIAAAADDLNRVEGRVRAFQEVARGGK